MMDNHQFNLSIDQSFSPAPCSNCDFRDEQILLLKEEVHILKDMLNTCQIYQQLKQPLYTNLVHAGTQTVPDHLENKDVEVGPIVQMGSYF